MKNNPLTKIQNHLPALHEYIPKSQKSFNEIVMENFSQRDKYKIAQTLRIQALSGDIKAIKFINQLERKDLQNRKDTWEERALKDLKECFKKVKKRKY